MLAGFAALEDRANAAVNQRLSNRLVAAGAVAFTAIFEDVGALVLEGMVESTEPRLMAVPADKVALLARNVLLSIVHPVTLESRVMQLVRSEPDGSGFHTLYLRKPEV